MRLNIRPQLLKWAIAVPAAAVMTRVLIEYGAPVVAWTLNMPRLLDDGMPGYAGPIPWRIVGFAVLLVLFTLFGPGSRRWRSIAQRCCVMCLVVLGALWVRSGTGEFLYFSSTEPRGAQTLFRCMVIHSERGLICLSRQSDLFDKPVEATAFACGPGRWPWLPKPEAGWFDWLPRFGHYKITTALGSQKFENEGVAVPYWALALVPAIAAYIAFARDVRQAFRLRRGRCIVCGYDLRASAFRCPGCGTRKCVIAVGPHTHRPEAQVVETLRTPATAAKTGRMTQEPA